MVIHTFAFRWNPGVTEEKKVEVIEAIRALQGQIPEVLESYVGRNFSPRSGGHELGGVMHFANRAAMETYNNHPVHQALLAWLLPLIQPTEVDFEV